MALSKLKLPLLLGIAFLAAGFGANENDDSHSNPTAEAQLHFAASERPARADQEDSVAHPARTMTASVTRRVEVSGRVVDPMGRPVIGARLYVGYTVRRSNHESGLREIDYPVRSTSDGDGSFHFSFVESGLDARCLDDSRPAVVAVAGGYGPAWSEVPDSREAIDLSLRLVDDLPLTGRVLDQNRQPVAGARVHVRELFGDSEERLTAYLRSEADSWRPERWRGPLPEHPLEVTTDTDGRFRMTGLGRDRIVTLAVSGRAIQNSSITAVTRTVPADTDSRRLKSADFEYLAAPSQTIRGAVRDRTTGQPVPGVLVWATPDGSRSLTDERGHFEIVGCPKMAQSYTIMAQPQSGQPYFASRRATASSPGPEPITVDINLVSGRLLSGRLIDQVTGQPPRAAVVEYYPLFSNAHSDDLALCAACATSSVQMARDGTYQLVVLPGPGIVCVSASPRHSYAAAVVDETQFTSFFDDDLKRTMGQHLCTALGASKRDIIAVHKFNALAPIKPDERASPAGLDIALLPARRIPGIVVGPSGEPLIGVDVVGLTAIPDEDRLPDSSFNVGDLNPRSVRALSFRHTEKNLGQALTVRGDETSPLHVALEPCGTITGRLIDQAGHPVPGVTVNLGASSTFAVSTETDHDGRFCLTAIPHQTYSLWLSGRRRLLKELGQVRMESGQSKSLGDLLLAN
jgi:protocatechuate 3,4-dioxygenase beta subunit